MAHEALESQYYQHGENSLVLLESGVHLQEDESSSFRPTTCSSGIQRFTNGTSNSIEAYRAALNGTKLWEDPEFGGDSSSLRWDAYGFSIQGSYSPPKLLLWKRPSEMGQGYSTTPSLWGDFGKPIPNGIKQMSLGDCWFLAAASAVAEQAERVYRFAHDREYNKNGVFRFYFWVKDAWYGINVDDRLPSRKYGSGFRPWAT